MRYFLLVHLITTPLFMHSSVLKLFCQRHTQHCELCIANPADIHKHSTEGKHKNSSVCPSNIACQHMDVCYQSDSSIAYSWEEDEVFSACPSHHLATWHSFWCVESIWAKGIHSMILRTSHNMYYTSHEGTPWIDGWKFGIRLNKQFPIVRNRDDCWWK